MCGIGLIEASQQQVSIGGIRFRKLPRRLVEDDVVRWAVENPIHIVQGFRRDGSVNDEPVPGIERIGTDKNGAHVAAQAFLISHNDTVSLKTIGN